MYYLLISIMCSVAVSVLLKIARAKSVAIEQSIAVNYLVAIGLCVWVLQPDISHWQAFLPTWWLFAALGVLLPSVFIIMAYCVGSAGIVRSDAAQRLSLFLPVLSAFLIFGETLTHGKIIGLVLAFVALACLLFRHSDKSGHGKRSAALLLGVWLGYGVIDILFKQLSKSGNAFSGNLLIAFVLAAILMFAYLLVKRTHWTAAGILTGLLLGTLNFANILSYVKAHQAMANDPTLVFTGMNIGVISLGTIVGALLFREKVNQINIAGIILAIIAIICLFYWQTIALWLGV